MSVIRETVTIMGKHDVIKWKHFPRYWPFVWGIRRSPVNSPHKGQWRGALMFSLICAWTKSWVNTRDAGNLRRYRAYYDVNVMKSTSTKPQQNTTEIANRVQSSRNILYKLAVNYRYQSEASVVITVIINAQNQGNNISSVTNKTYNRWNC